MFKFLLIFRFFRKLVFGGLFLICSGIAILAVIGGNWVAFVIFTIIALLAFLVVRGKKRKTK